MIELYVTDCLHRRLFEAKKQLRLISTKSLTRREIALARKHGLRWYYLQRLSEVESAEFFRKFDVFWDRLVDSSNSAHPFWRNAVSSKMQEWERSASYLALILFSLAKRSRQESLSVVFVCSSVQEEDVCVEWGRLNGWEVCRRPCLGLPSWIRHIIQEVRNALKWFLLLGICLYKKFYSPRYRRRDICGERHILITSLFYTNSFQNGSYIDPFFGSLHEKMRRKGCFATYLCEPLGKYREVPRKIGTCERARVLLPYSLIGWSEILLLALKLFGRRLGVHRSEFMRCDFSGLIKWNAHRFDHSFNVGAEIFHVAIRKLCKKEKFAKLIQLYEGNVFERACIQAFRKYAGGFVMGYSQGVVFSENLKLRITEKENLVRPEPDVILCTGPENARLMIQIGQHVAAKVHPACLLRHIPVADSKKIERASQSNILIALDGVYESASVLDWLLENAEIFENRKVTIRAHPNVPFGRLLKQCLNDKIPENVHESHRSLKADIENSFCVIYRQSSVGMQALLNGVPVIHLDVDIALDGDPIKELKLPKWVVRTPEDLRRALKEISLLDPVKKDEYLTKAAEYLRRYFACPDQDNIAPFYADEKSNLLSLKKLKV